MWSVDRVSDDSAGRGRRHRGRRPDRRRSTASRDRRLRPVPRARQSPCRARRSTSSSSATASSRWSPVDDRHRRGRRRRGASASSASARALEHAHRDLGLGGAVGRHGRRVRRHRRRDLLGPRPRSSAPAGSPTSAKPAFTLGRRRRHGARRRQRAAAAPRRAATTSRRLSSVVGISGRGLEPARRRRVRQLPRPVRHHQHLHRRLQPGAAAARSTAGTSPSPATRRSGRCAWRPRYHVDVVKLLPVTYAVVMVLAFLGISSIVLDTRTLARRLAADAGRRLVPAAHDARRHPRPPRPTRWSSAGEPRSRCSR